MVRSRILNVAGFSLLVGCSVSSVRDVPCTAAEFCEPDVASRPDVPTQLIADGQADDSSIDAGLDRDGANISLDALADTMLADSVVDASFTNDAGDTGNADVASGWAVGAVMPDFSLPDTNANSATAGREVSPRMHLGAITAWYFGHAT